MIGLSRYSLGNNNSPFLHHFSDEMEKKWLDIKVLQFLLCLLTSSDAKTEKISSPV